jgi:hypothetical protein
MDHGPRLTWDRHRVVRLASIASLVLLAISLGPPWFHALMPDPSFKRIIVRLLLAAQAIYRVALVTVPVAMSALAVALWWTRRREARRPRLIRGFVLCFALTVGLAMAESIAAAWLAWTQVSTPRLPTRFPDPPTRTADGNRENTHVLEPLSDRLSDAPDDQTLNIVVLGESSACGAPYHEWLSVGQIVAWKLREAIPHRQFRVELLAHPGIRLDMVHNLLAGLEHRPDLAILYAGHNEFDARYDCTRAPLYYADDETPAARVSVERAALVHSPVCQLIRQIIGNYRVSIPPRRDVIRPLVDVPVYTAAEYAERLHDFRTRLEAITAYCERLGALVVLVPPPANDAHFEPNRSFLLPQTTRAERAQFARGFEAARKTGQTDPLQGIAAYRALLGRQPGFAEAQYRLARLLEATGQGEEAHQHYVAARDCDGFPVRCTSDFLNVYHEVAARHPRAILVDAPELLRKLSPRGTVADEFFADGHHPSLIGYTALSQKILEELYALRAFDWPASSPAPVVTPADCAVHFGMNAEKWASVCGMIYQFYAICAPLCVDPSDRFARAEHYRDAIPQLMNGKRAETLQLPGVGIGGLPAHGQAAERANSR